MSVLINMEMPKSCWSCPCVNGENGYCQLRKEYIYGEVPRSCPLVPVPEHGWIPVTFEGGGLTADHFYPNGRWFDLENVTHWMPLPEPPKEET